MADLDRQLGQNLVILAQVIAGVCQKHTLAEAGEGTLNSNQYKILKIVSNRGDFAVSEIGRLLDVSSAAASKNIERLVQMGMVSRRPLPDDRRRLRLDLLPAAHDFLARYHEISTTKHHQLLQHFTPAEKRTLLDLVRRVVRFTLADERDAEMVCLQCAGECGDECVISRPRGSCRVKHYQPPSEPRP